MAFSTAACSACGPTEAPSIVLVIAKADAPYYEGSGPDQSKGMCLLDLPSASHFSPKASTLCVVALPQVDTCPGPTSEPGAFSNCTRCPGGVIGPVNASARAETLPGTSARQKARSLATSKSIGTTSIPSTSGGPQIV